MKFLHTADWQLAKPFARVSGEKRPQLRNERIEVIKRIGRIAQDEGAAFILVAGDLFDSATPGKSTVSAACSAIGQLGLPVIVIPGNHDHGGPGSIWEQEFFQREHKELAPNLRICVEPKPLELASAVIFPCPLMRRAESRDTTDWLRSLEAFADLNSEMPRIILAHGSTQDFGSRADDEEAGYATNRIDIDRLPEDEYDYLALGDWHGTKRVAPKAWYSGTPEIDRFPKGDQNDPGNILIVEAERGSSPRVTPVKTARFHWQALSFDFTDDVSLATLQERLTGMIGQRTNEDLLELRLTGSLGIQGSGQLEKVLESLEARLLRLKLRNGVTIAPTDEEMVSLTERHTDPLIARVARKLHENSDLPDNGGAIARLALRELHGAVAAET